MEHVAGKQRLESERRAPGDIIRLHVLTNYRAVTSTSTCVRRFHGVLYFSHELYK